MRKTFENGSILVWDGFLSDSAFGKMWDFIQEDTYIRADSEPLVRSWRPTDGVPLYGRKINCDLPSVHQPKHSNAAQPETLIYPTGRPVDQLISAVVHHAPEWSALVGEKDKDYKGYGVRNVLHSQGAGLSWHQDGPGVSGAAIFFCHPIWKVNWGGELLVLDWPRDRLKDRVHHHQFDDREEDDAYREHGIGRFVYPKPNRIVILPVGVPHKVCAINPAAGENLRCTTSVRFLAV